MPNNPISNEKQDQIINLSNKGWAIRRIATETGTCRPTVRKYQKIDRENKK
jgi:DNA-binding NarL/FixJ family response regulator